MKAASLASVLILAAAAQPLDIRGWSKATWGMTVAELHAALPVVVDIPSPERDFANLGRLQLRDIEIGPLRGDATFYFPPNTDRLVAIKLSVTHPQSPASSFAQLREALVEKYGRPTSSETVTDRVTTHTVQWNLKSTVIRLSWYEARSVPGLVSVRYTERNPADSL